MDTQRAPKYPALIVVDSNVASKMFTQKSRNCPRKSRNCPRPECSELRSRQSFYLCQHLQEPRAVVLQVPLPVPGGVRCRRPGTNLGKSGLEPILVHRRPVAGIGTGGTPNRLFRPPREVRECRTVLICGLFNIYTIIQVTETY